MWLWKDWEDLIKVPSQSLQAKGIHYMIACFLHLHLLQANNKGTDQQMHLQSD